MSSYSVRITRTALKARQFNNYIADGNAEEMPLQGIVEVLFAIHTTNMKGE